MDSVAPIASALTYANTATSGWQNTTNIVLNWAVTDPATAPVMPSGINNYDIRVYSGAAQSTPTTLLTTLSNVAAGATTYAYVGVNGFAYRFEVLPRDNAGNTGSWLISPDIVRIDTTVPNPTNLI